MLIFALVDADAANAAEAKAAPMRAAPRSMLSARPVRHPDGGFVADSTVQLFKEYGRWIPLATCGRFPDDNSALNSPVLPAHLWIEPIRGRLRLASVCTAWRALLENAALWDDVHTLEMWRTAAASHPGAVLAMARRCRRASLLALRFPLEEPTTRKAGELLQELTVVGVNPVGMMLLEASIDCEVYFHNELVVAKTAAVPAHAIAWDLVEAFIAQYRCDVDDNVHDYRWTFCRFYYAAQSCWAVQCAYPDDYDDDGDYDDDDDDDDG